MNDVDLSVGADTSSAAAGLASLRNYGEKAHSELSSIFARSIAFGGVLAATKSVIEYGAKVFDLGQRFGVSTTAIQRFGNAAEKNGSSLEGMTMGFNKLEIAISKALGGDEKMLQHFSALNVTIEDLKNLSPEQIMLKLGTSTMNAADTVAILGKNGLSLRPTLQGLANDTIEFGKAIDSVRIDQLKRADDTFKTIYETLKIVSAYLVGPIFEGIDTLSHEIMAAFADIKDMGIGTWQAIWAAAKGDPAGIAAAVAKMKDAMESAVLGTGKGTGAEIMRDLDASRTIKRSRPATGAGLPDEELFDESGASVGRVGPGKGRASGSGSSNLETLTEELAKLKEQHEQKQRTNQEQLEALKQQRAALESEVHIAEKIDEFGDKAILDDKEEAVLRQAQINLAKNQLELDKTEAAIKKDQLETEKAIVHAREAANNAAVKAGEQAAEDAKAAAEAVEKQKVGQAVRNRGYMVDANGKIVGGTGIDMNNPNYTDVALGLSIDPRTGQVDERKLAVERARAERDFLLGRNATFLDVAQANRNLTDLGVNQNRTASARDAAEKAARLAELNNFLGNPSRDNVPSISSIPSSSSRGGPDYSRQLADILAILKETHSYIKPPPGG